MKIVVTIITLWLGFTVAAVPEVSAMAQISLQNNTKLWLNLYIDGNFGCGPVMPNGFCTSSIKAGPHLLEAKKGGEIVAREEGIQIGDGTSPTWTVTIDDPNQALIKKLDGARYVNQREWPKIRAEYELVIRGTTLVWRMRFTWAAPEIAMPRPVGMWSEIDQVQIVGREAHSYRQAHSPKQNEVIFTIGEDGSGITARDGNDTYIFYRQ